MKVCRPLLQIAFWIVPLQDRVSTDSGFKVPLMLWGLIALHSVSCVGRGKYLEDAAFSL